METAKWQHQQQLCDSANNSTASWQIEKEIPYQLQKLSYNRK